MFMNIVVPRISTNDDYVYIGEWTVKNGDYVHLGEELVSLETSKEVVNITAERDGFIEILAESGADAKVGQTIAVIHANHNFAAGSSLVPETENSSVTEKARRLIMENGLDINSFPKDKIIRERDVLQRLGLEQDHSAKQKGILIYGGGGCGKIVINILRQNPCCTIGGIVDRQHAVLKNVSSVPVIGGPEDLQSLKVQGYQQAVNAVMFDGKKHGRKEPYMLLKKLGFHLLSLIHRSAIIEPDVRIEESVLVAAGAIIGAEATVRENSIINAGAIISHDCVIGSHCHIASGAILGGGVIVGDNTLIGQGCTIFKGIKIGKNVVIKNGSHVFCNVPDNTIY